MFPATDGIWRNLVQREMSQVHAICEHLTVPFCTVQWPDFSATKSKAQCNFQYVLILRLSSAPYFPL